MKCCLLLVCCMGLVFVLPPATSEAFSSNAQGLPCGRLTAGAALCPTCTEYPTCTCNTAIASCQKIQQCIGHEDFEECPAPEDPDCYQLGAYCGACKRTKICKNPNEPSCISDNQCHPLLLWETTPACSYSAENCPNDQNCWQFYFATGPCL